MAVSVILSLVGASLIYTSFMIYRRLFLSPISSFPGPKLAAATFCTNSNRRDRWLWQARGFGIPASTLGTVPHALHRHRRNAISPFFLMHNVRKPLPVVEERVETFIRRLKACGEKGEIISLEYAFSAFSNDVVMQYCFGRSDHHIEAPGFDSVYHNISFNAAKSIATLKHLNWILDIMQALPESVAKKMGPEVSSNIQLKNERIAQIEEIRQGGPEKTNEITKTIFHTLLQSDLPTSEKETSRLAEEAVLIVGAGTHTTSWCLTVSTFHLLSNPTLLMRLKAELISAHPDPFTKPSLHELEKLPFLIAVLKEGLRLDYGGTVRNARIAPDTSLKCGDWAIPPGTPVSMTIPLVHHDERIFPNPDKFDPDRWLQADSGRLDKYLVSFSRGSRACVGVNLAWAELYLCTAGVFRHFGSPGAKGDDDVGILELFETDVTDVALVSDMFFPVAKEGSKGVRAKVVL
ncbi:cytochrome P450 [Lentithecium fluviatile CBS 122367]|uniref:Cytochrome P450 n=1 Tax=Lentithecium fluviatile CBS 122367 TaxID=1168545 RepID=A0A6G1ITY6_9PLEO|nr:cytochrome P450 [Lentithecium fluviatile CBS 122367]